MSTEPPRATTLPPRAASLPPRATPPPPPPSGIFANLQNSLSFNRPKVRVTSEYDSDSGALLHKVSCKVLDTLAKLKLTFQNNSKGEISDPCVALASKYLSLDYDVEEHEAVVRTSFDVAKGLSFSGAHNFKAQQGEIAMVADLAGPDFKLQLSTDVPSIGMPRATLKFPHGEVSLEETDVEEDETKKVLLMSGILKGQLLNGLCTALYKDDTLNFRYSYKDAQMTFIPNITLPSNAISVAFKRRFGPSDKLSYWYNFDNDTWSTVYKHTVGKDYKLKAGYDSDVRLGWASLWVGDEAGKAKSAPMKMKVQFMLQVPQDDIQSSALMFRVKKRWDI